jgi:hypothetical protein
MYIVALVAITLAIAGCGSKQPLPSDEERQLARQKVPCIVVLPVQTQVNRDPDATYKKASELERGAELMDASMRELLVGRSHVRVLSARQFTSLLPKDPGDQLAMIKRIGDELNCNAILQTTLIRYRQRVGGSYAADAPASATFTFKLYDTRDGRVIWASRFQETQQSVMSNIMGGSNRGLTWLTVEELVQLGLAEQIEECPYL